MNVRYGACIPVQPKDAETDIVTEAEIVVEMTALDAEYEALVASTLALV